MMNGSDGLLRGRIQARFGWDAFPRQGALGALAGRLAGPPALDCDASAYFLDGNGGPVAGDPDGCCLYYGCPSLFGGAAVHGGDDRTGAGRDDEILFLDLDRLPAETETVLLTLDLFKEKRKTGRGQVQNTFVRLTDPENGEELARCGFTTLGAGVRLVAAARLCREDDGWRFVPQGEPCPARDRETFLRTLERRDGPKQDRKQKEGT